MLLSLKRDVIKYIAVKYKGIFNLLAVGKSYTTARVSFFFFFKDLWEMFTSIWYPKCLGSHWATSVIVNFILWQFFNHLIFSLTPTPQKNVKAEQQPPFSKVQYFMVSFCVSTSSLEYKFSYMVVCDQKPKEEIISSNVLKLGSLQLLVLLL